MKFELSHNKRNITDNDLLDDMRRVANEKKESILKQATYKDSGVYGVTTIIRRFGSWNGNPPKNEWGLEVEFSRY